MCESSQSHPHSTTDMSYSQTHFMQSDVSSAPEVAELSQAQYYRTLAKIENLTYRIGYLSSYSSANEETLELLNSSSILFRYFSDELVALTEAARKTLESAKIVPYQWASCPEKLAPHKQAYLELLKVLQFNTEYIDPHLQGRLRTLLMPLTSHFSISKNGDDQQPTIYHSNSDYVRSRSSSPTFSSNTHPLTPTAHEANSKTMLPPSAFPEVTVRRSHSHDHRSSAKAKRLWDPVEVAAIMSSRCRTRDSRARTSDQEILLPESQSVAFRPPRPQLRFGICFSRKSSFSGGRPAGLRSPLNSTE
ncbi:hypothetical protein CPB83DRAFT_853283 [Crepidotus variabilis]|uniref:Uncharacterized protein n=1 Tax=Crepidotus variabilis TaxID=179855 RepID=A0A9P6EHD8_9AGAR|nr:hypothetical protein CPB83DRAFT_853283 [Crepidotus variabilis]